MNFLSIFSSKFSDAALDLKFFPFSFFLRSKEAEEAIKNVLLLIMSLATCGTAELKPNYTPVSIVLPTFNFPVPLNKGLTLRNIDAIRLLFEIVIQVRFLELKKFFYWCMTFFLLSPNYFLVIRSFCFQCSNEQICGAAIDSVHNIYASDAANYFIADKECPLSQMIERIGSKPPQIQVFF